MAGCLDLLIDVARSVHDGDAKRLLLSGEPRILLDLLTLLNPAELPCIREFRVPPAIDDIRDVVRRLAPRVEVRSA